MKKLSYYLFIAIILLCTMVAKPFSQLRISFSDEEDDDCEVLSVPFHEGFNSNSETESCWVIVDQDPSSQWNLGWNLNSTYPVTEGDQSAKLQGYWSTPSSDDWLISPQVALTGTQQLRFIYSGSADPVSNAVFDVYISTSGSANPTDFVPLETGINMIFSPGFPPVGNEITIDLSAYSGNVRIAFHVPFQSSWTANSWGWNLDLHEVFIEELPACSSIGSVNVTEATNETALINWQPIGNETQWQVAVLNANETIEDIEPSDIILVNETTYLIENLTASSGYQFFVRSYCNENAQGAWGTTDVFYTDGCSPENKCTFKVITKATSNGGAYGYKLQIIQNNVVVQELMPLTIEDTFEIELCSDVPITMQWTNATWHQYITEILVLDTYQEVVTQWNTGDSTDMVLYETAGLSCAPSVSCFIPQNFQVSEVTQTSVELSWNEMGNANSWEILVLPQGEPIPNNPENLIVTNQNPYVVENLNQGTPYSFYVRAACSIDDKSNWSFEQQAHTIILNDDCIDAIQLPVSETFYCETPYHATLQTATQSPELVSCGNALPNDDVWFKFQATATSHVIFINNVQGVSGNINWLNDISLNKILYKGSCGNLEQVFCQQGNTNPLNFQINGNVANHDNDLKIDNLVVGETYYLRVYSNFQTVNNISFDVCISLVEESIIINDSQYTPEDLVTQVLMSNSCSDISNFSFQTGTTFGADHNGIAYFERGNSQFPFEKGVVLSTGKASTAVGNKLSIQSNTFVQNNEIAWLGDAEMLTYFQNNGSDTGLENFYNASILEFDFVGNDDNFTFNFIFASEDYGKFQCEWSDAFAFFLTDQNGNTQNLAVLPNTNIPISVTTLRNGTFNYPNSLGCSSENEAYFYQLHDGFMGHSRYASNNNFYGNSVPLTAQATIVPGQQYHIKLVIADRNDGNYDSAVFIEGGSFEFNPTLNLVEDYLVADQTAICPGNSLQLVSPLIADSFQYKWYKNDILINGQNGTTLNITEPGDYKLEILFSNVACSIEDVVRVEFYDDFRPLLKTPIDFEFCFDDLFNVDLTQQESVIMQDVLGDFTLKYFTSESDAQSNINSILNPQFFNFSESQNIYVRIESENGCFTTVSFKIIIHEEIKVTQLPDVQACTFYVLPQLNENEKYYTESNEQGTELFAGNLIEPGIHTLYISNQKGDCKIESTFQVEVKECTIPKGISPNGDGLNDILDLSEFQVKSLTIFNRYGTKVYSSSAYSNQWSGQDLNGKSLPSGTYFYEVVTPFETLTGWIQLIREVK